MSTITLTPISIQRPTQLRLTRRGRLTILVAAMLFVLAGAIFLGTSSVASNEASSAQQTEVIMVGYGETLWGISSDLAEDGQVRDMMRQIKELNTLDSSMLLAGQQLHIPTTG